MVLSILTLSFVLRVFHLLARRRCVGVYFRAMSMEWNEETGDNNQTTKRFPKYLSAQITCLLMILQSWLAIFMRNCGILQICKSSIRYHAMCFVQCTLACACARWYAKITINTYCVTYNLCIRGWFVFCALVCLFHSFFYLFRGWFRSMERTVPLYSCKECIHL